MAEAIEVQSYSELLRPVLVEYSALARTRMFQYLEPKGGERYLYDLAREYPARGGRGMRPALCMANAGAFGGDPEAAVLSAAAIEMLHNATLIHDDVEDESEMRRGRPTLHSEFGTPLAVNAGDLLMSIAMQPLYDNVEMLGHRLAYRVLREFGGVSRQAAEGQAMELAWRHENRVDLVDRDYHEMVFKKTSWLTIVHPMRIGALIGTKGKVDLEPFIRLGFFIGSAFQIQDDILNLRGDQSSYGKELIGDLAEAKRSLILIHLLRSIAGADALRLQELLGMSRVEREPHVSWIMDRINQHGSIEYAWEVAHAHAGAAQYEFEVLYGGCSESRDKQFIEHLIYWVIERS